MPRKTKPAKLAKIDPEDLPRVENEPSLQDWLEGHHARLLWQHDGDTTNRNGVPLYNIPPYRVAAYQIGTRTAIVVIRAKQAGWEIFTAGSSVDIDDTLTDAEYRLGVG